MENPNIYSLELENVYEGPMDVLISMIRKDKIDIFDIPILTITEQFLKYIQDINFINVGIALDFANMASTLLEIKSKMLLPSEAEEVEEDPRLDLVNRLIEYNNFKEISFVLRDYYDVGNRRILKKSEDLTFLSTEEFDYIDSNIDSLSNILLKILNRQIKSFDEEPIELPKEIFTLEKSLKIIRHKLHSHKFLSFTSLFQMDTSKSEIISFFLAMLELTKLNEIVIRQKLDEGTEDIIIYRR